MVGAREYWVVLKGSTDYNIKLFCERGEIGRRAGFRFQWQPRGSSSLPARTIFPIKLLILRVGLVGVDAAFNNVSHLLLVG